MTPFDIVKDILQDKQGKAMEGGQLDSGYVPFQINRAISMNVDLIFYSNEMNINWWLDKRLQYDFYMIGIEKSKRRRTSWAKLWTKAKDDDFRAVQEFFGYGDAKTKEAIKILTREQIDKIKEKLKKGV